MLNVRIVMRELITLETDLKRQLKHGINGTERGWTMDKVLEAFRCCITDQKCMNKDCPYESRCNICNNESQYLQIPKHLALDVERMLVDLILYKEDKEGNTFDGSSEKFD